MQRTSRQLFEKFRTTFKRNYASKTKNEATPPEFKEPREKVMNYYDKVVFKSNLPHHTIKPTESEKTMLVLTQVYRYKKEIPDMVGPAKMQKMHSRIKAFVFVNIVAWSYFLTRWYLRARDRAQGVGHIWNRPDKPLPRSLVSKD